MRILGVDPGLASTGIGVIESVGGDRWRALHSGHVTTSRHMAMPERLLKIHTLVRDCINEYRPNVLSIESIFFAKNVRSAVLMAHGRGVSIFAASQAGIELHEYSPLEIKQSVVGKGHATKEQVKAMVMTLLSLPVAPGSDHAADALAAALCHAYRSGSARQRAAAVVSSGGSDEVEERQKLLMLAHKGRRRRR